MAKNNSVKKKACNPGKITRNPFFNYLRCFRLNHCDWPVTQIAREGAKHWKKIPELEKDKYRELASRAPKVKRKARKRRRGKRTHLHFGDSRCDVLDENAKKCGGNGDGFVYRLLVKVLKMLGGNCKDVKQAKKILKKPHVAKALSDRKAKGKAGCKQERKKKQGGKRKVKVAKSKTTSNEKVVKPCTCTNGKPASPKRDVPSGGKPDSAGKSGSSKSRDDPCRV